jgi:hypothetical protein
MINPAHIPNLRPTDAELDQCHLVAIADPGCRMRAMKTWCWGNNLSLIWAELIEVDYNYDHVNGYPSACQVNGFWFIDQKDATVFTLKFK